MIIPELPPYLEAMGGGRYIGYIIALFTLAAAISRPFSGRLTDTIGRIPVMLFGSLVCFMAGFGYVYAHSVFAFLLLRFLHGMSTGTKPTATAAYVADITPENRRGEAQGLLSIFTAIGMSIGPTIGGALVVYLSINTLFVFSSIFALGSAFILIGMRETLPVETRQNFGLHLFRIKVKDFFEPRIISPAIVMFLTSFSSGVLLTLVPAQCKYFKISNLGIFFSVYTLASLVVRILFAKYSDRHGRIAVLKVSSLLLAVSMAIVAFAHSVVWFMLGAIIFGFSWGFNTPTLTAWTIDLSQSEYRGKALATMFIALEFGIGIGALVAGWLYGGSFDTIAISYILAMLLAILGILYLYYQDWIKEE